MRLCGKEKGLATWLSMQAPLTPPSVSDDGVLADCFCSALHSSHSSMRDEVKVGLVALFHRPFV